MARTRVDLQYFLEELLGNRNVYFQPPASVLMQYPAIVYSLDNVWNTSADDLIYMQGTGYQITVIDEDPDSEIAKKVSRIPTCRFNRFFTSDDLNHFVYTIYY